MIDGIPEPPDHLNDAAKTIWRAFAPVYQVTVADQPLYEQFCDSYARWQELIRRTNEVGPMVTIKGDCCTNPNLARADKEAANFKHALAMLLRTKHGRAPDADQAETKTQSIEEFRHLLIAQINRASIVDGGPAEDRPATRPARTKAVPVAARPVRKKKAT